MRTTSKQNPSNYRHRGIVQGAITLSGHANWSERRPAPVVYATTTNAINAFMTNSRKLCASIKPGSAHSRPFAGWVHPCFGRGKIGALQLGRFPDPHTRPTLLAAVGRGHAHVARRSRRLLRKPRPWQLERRIRRKRLPRRTRPRPPGPQRPVIPLIASDFELHTSVDVAPPSVSGTPAVGECCVGKLGDNAPHQAASRDKLSPLSMRGSQECFARGVDQGHTRQMEAKDGLCPIGLGALPTVLGLPHPGAGQLAFKLERQGFRFIVDGNAKHHFTSPGRRVLATLPPPPMNTSICWRT